MAIAAQGSATVAFKQIMTPRDLLAAYAGKGIDCIFVSCVFHHIPFAEHQEWLNALHDILTDGGCILVFEHNPYNPATRHIFKHSEIDRGATMLNSAYCRELLIKANFVDIERRYALFFPWQNKFFTAIESALFWLPLGAQYNMFAVK